MNRCRHCITWLLTAALALGLAGCSGAPSLPIVSPNPTVSITSSAGHELLTATRLDQNHAAQLTAELQQAAADPARAADLVSELGGAGLLRAVVLGSTVKDTGLADAVREVFQAGQSKLEAGTAQRVASELAAGLTVEDATQKANNVLALSFLLRDSTLNPELLIRLAPGLIETDQQVSSGKKFWTNQPTTWADITSSASPSVKNLLDGQDWTIVSDVLASYLTALGRDGVAGLAVFTDTPLGTTEPEKQNHLSNTALVRQRYLIEQRPWSHDQFTALTTALNTATTSKETVDTPLAAGVVSSTVEMLANRARNSDTNGQSLGHPDQEHFTTGNISDQAAQQVMHLVGTYLPAVGYYITPGQETTTTTPLAGTSTPLTIPGQDPHQLLPVLRWVDLTTITTTAATPHTIEQLRGYLDAYREHTFTAIARSYTADNPERSTAVKLAARTDAALEALHARITPQQEDVQESLDRITKTLYTSGIITLETVKETAARRGIAEQDVRTWFAQGNYPKQENIEKNASLSNLLANLRAEHVERNAYKRTYDAILNS